MGLCWGNFSEWIQDIKPTEANTDMDVCCFLSDEALVWIWGVAPLTAGSRQMYHSKHEQHRITMIRTNRNHQHRDSDDNNENNNDSIAPVLARDIAGAVSFVMVDDGPIAGTRSGKGKESPGGWTSPPPAPDMSVAVQLNLYFSLCQNSDFRPLSTCNPKP